jgi:hypothetical protein
VVVRVVLGFLIVAALAAFVWRITARETPNKDSGTSTAPYVTTEPQLDNQNGVRVLATYLAEESDLTQSTLKIEISSGIVDLTTYDFSHKIIWADTNIEPLPTLSSAVVTSTKEKLAVKMSFRRSGSHHHLIVRDLGGIKDRVLHFYL